MNGTAKIRRIFDSANFLFFFTKKSAGEEA
jgi:hypothetical protein